MAGGRQRGRRLFRGSTRRLVVLGAVFVLLAVMLIPTIRGFFAQRDSNATLADRVSRQQATVDALRQEIERYNDPAYVQQQARARLGYVKPGETSWRVVGGPDGQTGGTVSAGVAIPADPQGQKAYYEKVWSSIILADKATPAPAPAAPRVIDAITPSASTPSRGATPSGGAGSRTKASATGSGSGSGTAHSSGSAGSSGSATASASDSTR